MHTKDEYKQFILKKYQAVYVNQQLSPPSSSECGKNFGFWILAIKYLSVEFLSCKLFDSVKWNKQKRHIERNILQEAYVIILAFKFVVKGVHFCYA